MGVREAPARNFGKSEPQRGLSPVPRDGRDPEVSRTGPAPARPLLPPAVSHPQLSRCTAHSPGRPLKRHMASDQHGASVGTAFNLTHGAGRGATSRLSLDRRSGDVVCNRLEGRKAVPWGGVRCGAGDGWVIVMGRPRRRTRGRRAGRKRSWGRT